MNQSYQSTCVSHRSSSSGLVPSTSCPRTFDPALTFAGPTWFERIVPREFIRRLVIAFASVSSVV